MPKLPDDEFVNRARGGAKGALDALADLLGPCFLEEMLDRRHVLKPFTEILVVDCVFHAISRLLSDAQSDVKTVFTEIANREFDRWFRSFQTDVEEASRLQGGIFPRSVPSNGGLEIAARSRPLRPINGDLYDFIERPDDTLVVLVDASGKGTAAGLFAAVAGGFFRGFAAGNQTPSELLTLLNDSTSGASTDSKYLTILLVSWSLASVEARIASAGFPDPLVSNQRTRIPFQVESGPLIGLQLPKDQKSGQYTEVSLKLAIGDWIAVFSDGITDQFNSVDEEYGVDRLWEIIHANENESAERIVERVFADIDRHRGITSAQDDQTLVLIRAIGTRVR